MKIVEEKTRLIISEYTDNDERRIENMISSFDGTLFFYKDDDKKLIYLPSGIKDFFTKEFKISVEDHSEEFWQYDKMNDYELTIGPRDQSQIDAIDHVLKYAPNGDKIGLILPPGYGKGHPYSTKIPSPNSSGYILMGELKPGNIIFGSNGKKISVDTIYELGEQDIYRVDFSDGRYSYCTYEHLWNIVDHRGNQSTVMLKDMMDNWKDGHYRIPLLNSPVEYDEKCYTDDAYSVGYATCNQTFQESYLHLSIENRKELLQGLMDCGGRIYSMAGSMRYQYSSYNKELLLQILYLVRTLGYSGTLTSNGNNDNFYGTISFYKNQELDSLSITSITLSHKENARCIKVSAEDHLYLTEDFIVTHNTMISIYCAIKVGMKTLIIVPTSNLLKQWKDSFTEMFQIPEENINMVDTPSKFINSKADFTIVLQQTLSVLNKRYDLEKIMKANKFGIKIIDEAHMYFKNTIVIDGSSNIKNNWYLTATFGRSSDSENLIYHNMYGSIQIFRVKNKKPGIINRRPGDIYGNKPHVNVTMYWMKSGLTPAEVKEVSTSKQYSEREEKWIRYGISVPAYFQKVIPRDGTMTKFLKTCLEVIEDAGKIPYGSMLILTPTIYSANILKEHVVKMFPKRKVGTIHSRNSKQYNNDVKKTADIIISTIKSTGTGFDVPGLSACVTIEPFKSTILARQVFGRLRRRKDGKDTYYYDIVDSSVSQLAVWGNVRADLWKQLGKTFKVI